MTTRYESTTPPASMNVGTGNLGKRNDAGLAAAFDTPSGAAGVPRNTPDGQRELLRVAKEKMEAYDGENDMFKLYRRNFIPEDREGGTLPEEYVAVRNKNTVSTGTGTGLGTAYSPTIASPGVANGVSPANLESVAGNSSAVLVEATGDGGPNSYYNPSDEAHTNRSSEGTTDVGTVRRFKLGIASSTVTSLDPITNRGQFPRQPV